MPHLQHLEEERSTQTLSDKISIMMQERQRAMEAYRKTMEMEEMQMADMYRLKQMKRGIRAMAHAWSEALEIGGSQVELGNMASRAVFFFL